MLNRICFLGFMCVSAFLGGCLANANDIAESQWSVTEVASTSDGGIQPPVIEPLGRDYRCPDCPYDFTDHADYGPTCVLPHPGRDDNVLGMGASDRGTPIYNAAAGEVVWSDTDGSTEDALSWMAVTVRHQVAGVEGYQAYGHMEPIFVRRGDMVPMGAILGLMNGIAGGDTRCPGGVAFRADLGTSFPPHLHWEERNAFNARPTNYNNFGTPEECTDNYFPCFSSFATVRREFDHPEEFVVSNAMDGLANQYASVDIGSVVTDQALMSCYLVDGSACVPGGRYATHGYPAFPDPTAEDVRMNRRPVDVDGASGTRTDDHVYWWNECGLYSGIGCGGDNFMFRLYAGGRLGLHLLVFDVNGGARFPRSIRTGFLDEWLDEGGPASVSGMPIGSEMYDCSEVVVRAGTCRKSIQLFQFRYMTWDWDRAEHLRVERYDTPGECPAGMAVGNISPGAFEFPWGVISTVSPRRADMPFYTIDDAADLFTDAYHRVGGHRRLGMPCSPILGVPAYVHRWDGTPYWVQNFRGGEWGEGIIFHHPYDPSLARESRSRISHQAFVLRSGFWLWFRNHDGIHALLAPRNDEYWDAAAGMSRQDFESGNCLVWRWTRPGVGGAYCGRIEPGGAGENGQCRGYEGNADHCPEPIAAERWDTYGCRGDLCTSGDHIERSDIRPDGRGGGGGSRPDAGTPTPDAGTPSGTPCDCAFGWRCESGVCREVDLDGDGYLGSLGDCNPEVARIHPGAAEICDGRDDNCDGVADEGIDLTSDPNNCGSCNAICVAATCITRVCVPICVPSPETCNGLDDDCDSVADDGVPNQITINACGLVTERCTSGAMVRISGRDPVAETCNGLDDNCDGTVDGFTQPCPYGCSVAGVRACTSGGWSSCTPTSAPPVEICNGLDDDCDGRVDEGCAPVCTPVAEVCDGRDQDCDGVADDGLAPLACYDGPSGTSGRGICRGGTRTCSGGSWGSCVGQVLPRTESCNGLDDDCDGVIDDGVCAPACVPTSPSRDICDGRDNDCDGTVDNGCPAMNPYLVEIWMDPSMLDDCPDPGGFRINLWGPGGSVLRNVVGQPFRRAIDASWPAASAVTLSCSVAPTWHDWTGHVGEASSLNGVLVMRLGGRDMLPTSLVCDDMVNPAWGAKPYLPLESRYEGSCTPRW